MSNIAAQLSTKINQLSQEFNLITHNMANVSTTGFKRRINDFSRIIDSKLNPPDPNAEPTPPEAYDFSQGGMNQSGRKLDFALFGKGFFTVETPDGPLYTRNGMFQLDKDGKIVDSQGRFVSGDNGPISIPPNVSVEQVSVANDGNITANGITIGKFKLADFGDDQSKLIAVGSSCFQMPDKRVKVLEPEDVSVKQGFLEGSNVQLVEELVDMVMVSRMYESNMKFVSVKKDASQSLMSVAMA